MKGGVQWYLWGTHEGRVVDVLSCCAAAGLSIGHRRSGIVTYLDATAGHEGEPLEVPANDLAATVERRIDGWGACTVVLWLNDDTDILCSVERVRSWDCTSFEFDFDGLTRDQAREAATMLFAARHAAAHPTALWLIDFVGLGHEHGAAHEWDGTHAPGWPPPA